MLRRIYDPKRVSCIDNTILPRHLEKNSSFTTHTETESQTGRIKYNEHRFDQRDKQITCDHDCVEIDLKHGR